jgi:hypothetical protein
MQKSMSDWTLRSPLQRSRGFSESKTGEFPSSSSHPLSRVSPTATVRLDSSATIFSSSNSGNLAEAMRLTSRDRSTSVGHSPAERGKMYALPKGCSGPSANSVPWWDRIQSEVMARPWNGQRDCVFPVPDEQKENWEQTRNVGKHLYIESESST